jgi:hypothetical protein
MQLRHLPMQFMNKQIFEHENIWSTQLLYQSYTNRPQDASFLRQIYNMNRQPEVYDEDEDCVDKVPHQSSDSNSHEEKVTREDKDTA